MTIWLLRAQVSAARRGPGLPPDPCLGLSFAFFMFSFALMLIYAIFFYLIHMGKRTVILRLGDGRTNQDIF